MHINILIYSQPLAPRFRGSISGPFGSHLERGKTPSSPSGPLDWPQVPPWRTKGRMGNAQATAFWALIPTYVCVHIHACIYVYLCVSMCIYVYLCVFLYLCTYVPMYLRIYVPMYLCNDVSIYLCTYVPMYLCICASVDLCICVSVCLCIYVSVYLYLYVCIYRCMYVCMHVCMYEWACGCICMCMCICKYKSIHVNTHVDTCVYLYIYICDYICDYIWSQKPHDLPPTSSSMVSSIVVTPLPWPHRLLHPFFQWKKYMVGFKRIHWKNCCNYYRDNGIYVSICSTSS